MNGGSLFEGIISFGSIYDFIDGFVPESLDWLVFTIGAVLLAFIVINVMVMSTAVYTWFERRTLGRFPEQAGSEPVGAVWSSPAHRRPSKADYKGRHYTGGG